MRRLCPVRRHGIAVTAAAILCLSPAGIEGAESPPRRYGSQSTRPAREPVNVNVDALAAIGIRRYESQRLVLYSDIDPAVATELPPLIDAAYVVWTRYFGELPPAEDGGQFQLTGCLMKNRRPFLEAGLLPEDLVDFEHGRHRGCRFWMNEQAYDYYRRHLLIHEATHCYMMILPEVRRPPLFYLEGMAEFFGTHAIDSAGQIHFGVMPADPEAVVGFGRIEMIQRAVAEGHALSFDDAVRLDGRDFARSKSDPYAWSWALCQFLETHPRYRERFRDLASISNGMEFRRRFNETFIPDRPLLERDWELFASGLEYGYDTQRAAVDYRQGEPLPPGGSVSVTVDAARGWQCTGVAVEAGQTYQLIAEGTVTLAGEPRPWISEPQGISIRYAGGRPIGRVLAGLDSAGPADDGAGRLTEVIDVGRGTSFMPAASGTLYLRVNDAWGSLADNAGGYRVSIDSQGKQP